MDATSIETIDFTGVVAATCEEDTYEGGDEGEYEDKDWEDGESEDVLRSRLTRFYEQASAQTVEICEAERRAIRLGRREYWRQETQRFMRIRDALRTDNLHFKDWCAAAGEDYRSVLNAINYLERCEECGNVSAPGCTDSQRGQPVNDNGERPAPTPRAKPGVTGKARGFHSWLNRMRALEVTQGASEGAAAWVTHMWAQCADGAEEPQVVEMELGEATAQLTECLDHVRAVQLQWQETRADGEKVGNTP